MTRPSIPASLAPFYRWDGDALVVRGTTDVAMGKASIVMAAVFAGLTWVAMIYGNGLCMMLGGAMVPAFIVWGAMLLLDREDLPLRLDDQGLTLRQHGTVHYQQVSLSGVPGESIRLAVLGQHGWLELHLGFPTPPWDLEGLIWFADRLAEHSGVELTGDFDRDTWRLWARDPSIRPKLKLDRLLAASREAFPSLLDVPAAEPEGIELGMDGLVWGSVTLNRDELRADRHALLDAVEQVEVVIGDQAVLYVRTSSDLRPVLARPRSEEAVGELQWLAEKVRQAARAAQAHDEGHHGDIPEALKRLAKQSES